MQITAEKHLSNTISREQSLQQIIKQQQESLILLEQKLSAKCEHLLLPIKLKHAHEITQKDNEIFQLKKELDDLKIHYSQEKLLLTNVLESTEQKSRFEINSYNEIKENLLEKAKDWENNIQEEKILWSNLLSKYEKEISNFHNNSLKAPDFSIFTEFFKIHDYFHQKEEFLSSEIVHYRSQIEILHKNLDDLSSNHNLELQKILKKLNNESNINSQFSHPSEFELESLKKQISCLNTDILNKNQEISEIKSTKNKLYEEIIIDKEKLENQLIKQREDFLNQIKQREEDFEIKLTILSKEMTIMSQEKAFELEKFIKEIENLKNEKNLLEKNLTEAKNEILEKDNSTYSEIMRQKISIEKLIELAEERERVLQGDIKKLAEIIHHLHESYNNKEDNSIDIEKINDVLNKIVVEIEKAGKKINNIKNSSGDNSRINEINKDYKEILKKYNEKTKELQEFKEKKIKENGNQSNLLEKILINLIDLQSKMPSFIEISGNNIENDLEYKKYEQKIMENEAELNLAKKSLIIYMNHVKEIQEELGQNNIDLEEIKKLQLENSKLKEENSYFLELKNKTEEIFKPFLGKTDKDKIGFNQKLIEFKKISKNISDLLSNLNRNIGILLGNNRNYNMENEIIRTIRDEKRLLVEQNKDLTKTIEKDYNIIIDKIKNFDEILSDPLNLYRQNFQKIDNFCDEIKSLISPTNNSTKFWEEIKNIFSQSPILKTDLFYEHEQQSIAILRTETQSLFSILQEEKSKHLQELQQVSRNLSSINKLQELKIDSLNQELSFEKQKSQDIQILLNQTKENSVKELKKLRFEINQTNKMISERIEKDRQERKKLKEEKKKLEILIENKDIQQKKIFEAKNKKFIEEIENYKKIIQEKTAQEVAEINNWQKIINEREKIWIGQKKCLFEQINELKLNENKDWEKENLELIRENETFAIKLKEITEWKDNIDEAIKEYRDICEKREKLCEQREEQMRKEILYLKSHFLNNNL